MKIVPINQKIKSIGDMVLAIGEEVELGEGYEKEVLLVLKDVVSLEVSEVVDFM